MTSQSKSALQLDQPLAKRDLADYGVARFRDQVFDAVLTLWRRRKSEGWTQKQVADSIGRDPGWVSRNLRAPGNWTLRIAGELIQALEGEAEIGVIALEDPQEVTSNFDAYKDYISPARASDMGITTATALNPQLAQIVIGANQGQQVVLPVMPMFQVGGGTRP